MCSGEGKRRGLWFRKLLLVAFGLLAVFGVLELILSLRGFGNLVIYGADEDLFWKPLPNQQCFTKIGHQPVRINALGTRGGEFAPKKPAGVFRILTLGDSRTFGWGLAEEETYAAVLGDLLKERTGAEVEVINAGVNAWSYEQMYVYLKQYGADFDPDVVVLSSANLWTQFRENSSDAFKKKFLGRVRLKNLLRRSAVYHYLIEVRMEKYYDKVRKRMIQVDAKRQDDVEATNREDYFTEVLTRLVTLAAERGIRPVLLHMPRQTDLGQEEPAMIRTVTAAVARERNVPFVDLTDALGDGEGLYLESDPFHMNARGNRVIAERLADAIAPLVADNAAESED